MAFKIVICIILNDTTWIKTEYLITSEKQDKPTCVNLLVGRKIKYIFFNKRLYK